MASCELLWHLLLEIWLFPAPLGTCFPGALQLPNLETPPAGGDAVLQRSPVEVLLSRGVVQRSADLDGVLPFEGWADGPLEVLPSALLFSGSRL